MEECSSSTAVELKYVGGGGVLQLHRSGGEEECSSSTAATSPAPAPATTAVELHRRAVARYFAGNGTAVELEHFLGLRKPDLVGFKQWME